TRRAWSGEPAREAALWQFPISGFGVGTHRAWSGEPGFGAALWRARRSGLDSGGSARLGSCASAQRPDPFLVRSHAMSQLPGRVLRGLLFSAIMLALFSFPALAKTPRIHAVVGGRIVVAPGQVIEGGTIVMRDGVITAVGAGVPVPADARVWEGDSLTVYPGLIDAFVLPAEAPAAAGPQGPPGRGRGQQAAAQPSRGAAHELSMVRAETRVSEMAPLSKDQTEGLRAAGFAAAQVAPRTGILRGQSAVVGLGEGTPRDLLVKEDAAQVIALEAAREGYPGSLMGAIAVIRQAFLDAKWYRDALAAYARAPHGVERPETNLAWEALQTVIGGKQPALFVADEMLEVL